MAMDADFWKEIPFAQPPPGVTPNFANPEWHGIEVVIVSAICLPILLVLLGVRVFAKWRITKKFTIDDYVYFVSWPAGVVLICLLLAVTVGGLFGYHPWDLTVGNLTKTVLVRLQVLQIASSPIHWLYRLALFSLIYFVFAPFQWTRILVYVGIIVSFIVYLVPTITFAIACRPRGGTDQLAWIEGFAAPECASSSGLVVTMGCALAAFNVLIDLYLLALPIPAIRRLQVSKSRKLRIYLVFGTAVTGCLVSVIVLIFRVRAWGKSDLTYKIVSTFAAMIVEVAVGLAIPCAASISAVWKHFRGEVNNGRKSIHRSLSYEGTGHTDRYSSVVRLGHADEMDRGRRSWDDGLSHGSEVHELISPPGTTTRTSHG